LLGVDAASAILRTDYRRPSGKRSTLMKITLRGSRLLRASLLVALAGLMVAVTPSEATADGLDKFTGYTRPGTPPDEVKDNKIVPIAADDKKAIGGTVYFRVYDLADGGADDAWNTGYKNLDTISSRGSTRPAGVRRRLIARPATCTSTSR